MSTVPRGDQPWEHPDWYDLHDATWTAGPEREPEHYRELVLALPPLDLEDHLIDAGAGTGKLAGLIAQGYPRLGRVTLIEPNASKLTRARARLEELLPAARVDTLPQALGEGRAFDVEPATVVTIGSVLMPVMELRGGSLEYGLRWLRAALGQLRDALRPGGSLFDVETLAPPWARGDLHNPVRRLTMLELVDELARAGLDRIECAYRFRDRVILRGRRPEA